MGLSVEVLVKALQSGLHIFTEVHAFGGDDRIRPEMERGRKGRGGEFSTSLGFGNKAGAKAQP